MSKRNIKKRLRIFDDWKSAVHFMLGIAYSYLHLTFYALSFLILILFITYQIFESKSKLELLYDITEFCCGVIAGYILLAYAGAYASIHY
jgi:uncharacterized membrane protein